MSLRHTFAPRRRFQSLARLIGTLSFRQLWPLWTAVFCTFAMLGFVLDIMTKGQQPALLLAMNVIAGGTLSVLYLRISVPTLRKRPLVALLTAHALYSLLVPRAFALLPETPYGRVLMDAIWTIGLVVVSYSMFLRFINSTAARLLRADAEINVAREIHHGLVPDINRRIGAFEFFGWSIASGAVGGDLVDLVDDGDRWLGYVADVSGHGVGPGVIMGMFKSALRMRARGTGSLGDLLADVHTVLMPLKPAPTFVTVACIRGTGDDRLECAVAGHLPILRVRSGLVEEVTEPHLALGMFEHTVFESCVVNAAPGDLFVLLTDGLIEVFDSENRELGFEWAKRTLAQMADASLTSIADRLLTAARAHGAQLDDQTLLLVRRTAA